MIEEDERLTKEDYARAAAIGLKQHTVYSRVYCGWDKERAITTPVRTPAPKQPKPQKFPMTEERKEYLFWLKVAKEKGIQQNTYYYRVNKMDMTPMEAAYAPLGERGKYER